MPVTGGTTMIDLKARLVEALRARGDLGAECAVHWGFPNPDRRGNELILVADVNGDQEPATLRAGGGTRDEVYFVDLVVAVHRRGADPPEVARRAEELVQIVEQTVK